MILTLLLSACSGSDSAQESGATSAPPPSAAEPREETVFDPLVGTIDRAKGIDSTAAGRMDELNQQLDEAE